MNAAELARETLRSWPARQRLLTMVNRPGAMDDDCLGLLTRLRQCGPGEQSAILWKHAVAGRRAHWERLRQLLGEHLKQIEHTAIACVEDGGLGSSYAAVVANVIRRWPGSVTRTPSSTLFPIAMVRFHRGPMDEDFRKVAAALALYYQGIVIFDNIADGELEQATGSTWPRGQLENIALTMAAALPIRILSRAVPTSETARTVLRHLSDLIVSINVGQFRDNRVTGPVEISEAEAMEIAYAKGGSWNVSCARITAEVLELSADQRGLWEDAAFAFATARQLASDVADIWQKPFSPDLGTGKCTLPIAYALGVLEGAERARFQRLRELACYEKQSHYQLRAMLERLDAPAHVQTAMDGFCQKGKAAMAELCLSGEPLEWISTWAAQADIFGDICG